MKFCTKKLSSAHESRKRYAIAKSAIAIWPTRCQSWSGSPDPTSSAPISTKAGWSSPDERRAEGVHPDDYQRCLDIHASAFERREPFVMECRLRHRSGGYRRVLDRGVPQFNSDGTFLGYVGGAVDTHDRKLAEETLHQSEEQLRHTLEFNQAVMAGRTYVNRQRQRKAWRLIQRRDRGL